MHSEVVELTRQMIMLPSVNPQEKLLTERPYGEKEMADFVTDWLQKASIDVQKQLVRDGRENVLAMAQGKDTSQTLLLCAHMDTVDVKDMDGDPFDPQIRDGRIYGRGACDDKGPLAALLMAYRNRLQQGKLPINLALLASCGEEYDMAGSKFCASQIGRRLSGVVICEPTELNVIVAHKGVVRLRLTTHGISGHSSMPHHYQNAIYPMAQAITVIKRFADELTQRPAHPKLETETLSVTIVKGGYQINIIPDRCSAQIDWRILPGRTPQACRDELAQYLSDKINESIDVESINAYEPMDTPADHALVQALINAAQKTGINSTTQAVPYATDASAFNNLNIPTPIIGPGHPTKAHTRDEYIEIDQLEKGVTVYKTFLDKMEH